VSLVDGTTVSMPDTVRNQRAFPQPNTQKPGVGFPIARLVRWNIELDLRSIKDVLKMDVLRCKSPEMVEKEVWTHILAYNLIRGMMARAAKLHDKQPRQLSFKGTLQTMTAFQDVLRWATPKAREIFVQALLEAASVHRVGNRPGRVEPRANKRRPKTQRFLMEPRKQARKRLLEAA
jgi:hypothetical protein